MTVIPLLKNYDINVLVVLGNRTNDEFSRNQIKLLIVEKILLLNYSMFYLTNKFRSSDKILKEAYAKVIIMLIRDDEYYIDDDVLDNVLKLVSLDDLIYYGAESCSLEIRNKCIQEFWNRAIEIEDKIELSKKKNLGKRKLKKYLK